MKWTQVTALITGKLKGTIEKGRKHDWGYVAIENGVWLPAVKLGHHKGKEMKPHEVGGCARSLKINEHEFKRLEVCTLSQPQFCEIVRAKFNSLMPSQVP